MASSSTSSTCLGVEACYACSVADVKMFFRCRACDVPGKFYLCCRCIQQWRCPKCQRAALEDFVVSEEMDEMAMSSSRRSVSGCDGVTLSLHSYSTGSTCAASFREEPPESLGAANAADSIAIPGQPLLFVAVPEPIKETVLREGFKTRRRNHVPAACTQEHAETAFRRRQRIGHSSVVAITSLQDGTGRPYSVTLRSGKLRGCRIWTPGLPSRCLMDATQVLYVAIPHAVRDVILREGYKPSQRRSVPTSTSRDGAVSIYRRYRTSPYEVLGVLVPANMPRRAHKGGFKLDTPLLQSEFLRQLL